MDVTYLSPIEIARRLNVSVAKALVLMQTPGFPEPDPLMGNKRFWPAVEAWLFRRHGISANMAAFDQQPDGKEDWS